MSGSTLLAQSMPHAQFINPQHIACPNCGNHVDPPEQAHRRIEELEAQVRILNAKAAGAVDKLADYEDEVRSLRAQCARLQQQQQQVSERPQSPLSNNIQSSPPRASSRLASLSSFLPIRRRDVTSTSSALPSPALNGSFFQSTPNLASPLSHPNEATPPSSAGNATANAQQDQHTRNGPLSLQSLQSSLETERSLRMRAESSLSQTQVELEELTATLFGQANEMVAAERKARHKLEERVKLLETRDGEKRKRLDRLETALQRIERVRGLVEKNSAVVEINVTELLAEGGTESNIPVVGIKQHDVRGKGHGLAEPRTS